MRQIESQTIEQVLFERMGISVEDALASATDVVDEQVAQADAAGVDVQSRLSGLLGLLLKISEPENLRAIATLIERLPQLAQLARLAEQAPQALAALGDVFDETQQRFEAEGVDLETSFANGLRATLWLSTQIKQQDLERLGDLLKSDMLSHEAIAAVSNAANAVTSAQRNACNSDTPERIGLFGMLKLMRKPEIQRSLAFAARFAECFGRNVGQSDAEKRAQDGCG